MDALPQKDNPEALNLGCDEALPRPEFCLLSERGNRVTEHPNISLKELNRMPGRLASPGCAQRLLWSWQLCPGEESLPL